EITVEGSSTVVCSGGNLPSNAVVGADCCLADGCYALRVLDAAGDGMTTGGYVLQTQAGARIIDNRNNFSTGSVSAISGGQGFCLPISNQGLIFTSCDKLDWITGQYMVAAPNPAVSAEWIVGGSNAVQDNNSGYEFWIFDPNGSYSFRRFRSHNVSDGFGPASAIRACHMKLNNWAVASQIPQNVLMNVRVRTRINGVNGEFGPACRMAINPVLAACPRTNLMDIPGNQFFSCGVFRNWGAGNYVYARPVSGANRYQFRFRQPAEGFEVVRTATTYFVQLNWAVNPLQNGETYDVDVRISRDGGLTWCTSSDPWGNICQVTIGQPQVNTTSTMVDDQRSVGSEPVTASVAKLFPNPTRGDLVTLTMTELAADVNTVNVDIFDLYGKRVMARTIAVADAGVNTVLDLNGSLAAGMYLVNITAGDAVTTERLVVQP
ncbi:MAG: T9SS type A sorting domain-containing protein, partial [Flavobacteriales bacterium]|nr:T9SS type A sorting domain-containing protein [Flavobacteriales bacterium]